MPAELVKARPQGIVSRIRSWFGFGSGRKPSKVRWELTGVLAVPAAGETYDFIVDATGTWIGTGIGRMRLNSRINKYENEALQKLQAASRLIGRQYPPQQAGPAEAAINHELAGGWNCDDNVRFEVTVALDVDEAIREHLADAVIRMIDLESNAAYSRREAQVLDELVPRWEELLSKIGRNLEAVHATRLADANGAFATSVHEIVEEGLERSNALRGALERSIKAYKDVDLYEFATSYDTALTALMTYMGIPTGEQTKQEKPAQELNGHGQL